MLNHFFSLMKPTAKFLWGTATSAYQVEGAWNVDGKGESNWDVFSHKSGNMVDGATGDVACDHYHRFREDIKLMKELGVNAYRFSISWSRIFPKGTGKINQEGLGFYRNIIDALKEANIMPVVTIFHWDLPQSLEEKGGWIERETANAYLEYAKTLFKEFGDDVPYWITHNEPRVVATRGYGSKTMAPGTDNPDLINRVAHHLLLSHGLAINAYRQGNYAGKIGITLNLKPAYPASANQKDVIAANLTDMIKNRSYLEPILTGNYPDSWIIESDDFIKHDDLEIISAPIDFLGVNYYSRAVVKDDNGRPKSLKIKGKQNCLGWETYPQGLHDILMQVGKMKPDLPLLVTENGLALEEKLDDAGKLLDQDRIDYLVAHIQSVRGAISEGINVQGYFAWSFMDNLEWSFGYRPRFGLVYVDHNTQKRTPKASFYKYRELIKNNFG